MKTMIGAEKNGKTCKPQRIPKSEKMTANQIQSAYNEIADQYEKKIWFDQHILGVARLRKNLLAKATGKILEVACGTGSNIPFFPTGSDITAVDLSPKMLEVARANAIKQTSDLFTFVSATTLVLHSTSARAR